MAVTRTNLGTLADTANQTTYTSHLQWGQWGGVGLDQSAYYSLRGNFRCYNTIGSDCYQQPMGHLNLD